MPRKVSGFLLPLILTALAASASANPGSEAFRMKLDRFMAGAQSAGAAAEAASAREALATLSAEQLAPAASRFTAPAHWEQVPTVMAAIQEATDLRARERIAEALAQQTLGNLQPDPARELERFRGDFLFMLEQLGRFRDVLGPEFGAEVDALYAKIESVPPAGIAALQQVWAQRAAEMQAIANGQGPAVPLHGLADTEGFVGALHTPDCDKDCGDVDVVCWIDEAGCWIGAVGHILGHIATFIGDFFNTQITSLVNSLSQLGTKAIQFFTQVFSDMQNWITDQFDALLALLPTSVNDAIAWVESQLGIDFDNLNWESIASSIPTIAPPCPEQAVAIAAEVCDRGGDALTELFYELAPDDGLSFLAKLGLGLVHFPLAYLCQCADIEEAIAFADAQEAHRTLTATNLDLKLSTRATGASVGTLSANVADVDGDVGVIRDDTLVELKATTDRIEAKIDALTGGNADQQDWLAEFDVLMTRLNIEQNLLENKPDVISMFQLPAAFGGMLETVGAIVATSIQMNLDAGQNVFGAERELQRGNTLRAAGDFVRAFEAYRSAYAEAVK